MAHRFAVGGQNNSHVIDGTWSQLFRDPIGDPTKPAIFRGADQQFRQMAQV